MKIRIRERLGRLRPRRRTGGILLGLSLAVLAGLVYAGTQVLSGEAEGGSGLQTATVRTGDLVLLASGSGTLLAEDEIRLGFGAQGTIAALRVKVGDPVKAGDVLAEQAERKELEAELAADQLALIEAQEALADLKTGADLARAQA